MGIAPVAHPHGCCRSAMDSSCFAFWMHTCLLLSLKPLCFFQEDYHPFLYVWRGLAGGKQKTSVYIYLKMDCQCLNHMRGGGERRDRRERKKEKVILLVVTRGDIWCREIAVYCFCGRGNVNWLCGCATSHGGRRRTKWTQNTPWEGSQFL